MAQDEIRIFLEVDSLDFLANQQVVPEFVMSVSDFLFIASAI